MTGYTKKVKVQLYSLNTQPLKMFSHSDQYNALTQPNTGNKLTGMSDFHLLPNRFCFTISLTDNAPPQDDALHKYMSCDHLQFPHFHKYFGPPSLYVIYEYWSTITAHLVRLPRGKILHHWVTKLRPRAMVNSAVLAGCFAILFLERKPRDVLNILTSNGAIVYENFCDTTLKGEGYITLGDVLNGIHVFGNHLHFFDIFDFNSRDFKYLGRGLEYNCLSWVVPGKFIAFCGPQSNSMVTKQLLEYFKRNDVTAVVRLNEPHYDKQLFLDNNIKFIDLEFPDCCPPSIEIVEQFLAFVNATEGVIAVHCRAGLGRTGTLIAIYLVNHFRVSPMDAVAWMRLCRPGSVVGSQLEFLLKTCKDYGAQRPPLPDIPFPVYSIKAMNSSETYKAFRFFYKILNSIQNFEFNDKFLKL